MPGVNRRRLGTVLGINQTLSWGASFFLPAVVAAPAGRDLHMSGVVTIGAFSASLLIGAVCAPAVGRRIDRHGGRGMIAASILVLSVGLAILSFAPDAIAWYAGWMVLGVGMAMGLYDAAFSTAGRLLGAEAGSTISGITVIAGFASSVFWTLGTVLIGHIGWRGLLLVHIGIALLINLPMVLLLVPKLDHAEAPTKHAPAQRMPVRPLHAICLGGFFTLRWFVTSAIAAHILVLFGGLGLGATLAVATAAMVGPSQVTGRILESTIGQRFGLLPRARVGALLFPVGAAALLIAGPPAAAGFAVLYGMSNGILTINRGTLPLALFGPHGYASVLGWLAVPVQVAQALAPTAAAPLVNALPALDIFLIAGALGAVAYLLLLPLRLPDRYAPRNA